MGRCYKIDVRSGEMGRIVWRMDPGQEKLPLSNRGAALWAPRSQHRQLSARVIATDKDTGKVVWETNLHDQPDVQAHRRTARGQGQGHRRRRRRRPWHARLDRRARCRDRQAPVAQIRRSGAGRAGSETGRTTTTPGRSAAAPCGSPAPYDAATNQGDLGHRQPGPDVRPDLPPGDNLYTDSMISWNPDTGNMNWYFQYVPGDMWDYDEAHSHILIDGQVGGQSRQLITHSARNGFLYTFERSNGQTVLAKPYVENITWTSGIDQKTGKPVDYDPSKDLQVYSGKQNQTVADPVKKLCPSMAVATTIGRPPTAARPSCSYIPSVSSCNEVTLDPSLSSKAGDWKGAKFKISSATRPT